MLTTNKNPRYSYVRRLIALPLLALVVLLFAFRAEHHQENRSPLSVIEIVNSGHLSDTLIIRDSTGILKVEKAKVSIVDNSTGGKDTIITILKGNSTNRNFNGKGTIESGLITNSKSSEPLTIIDGKISENGYKNIPPDEIKSIDILKGISAISKYGEAGKNGVIIITKKPNLSKALYIIDGKIADKESIDINQLEIKSVDVLKGDSAISKYGEDGKNGVIIITTKKS